jgi:16S rRNA (guanine527-N7)-methyltransferase
VSQPRAPAPSPTATSSFDPSSDPRLRRWLDALVATPGLTAIDDVDEAWRVHVEGSAPAIEVIRERDGPIVDVGSGGGSPGFPLAATFPKREVTLLEAQERKAAFLERIAHEFPNVRVVRGRAEEQATDRYLVAVARALASPPVAAEWCLPLVAVGGAVVLLVGPSADFERVARVAARVGGGAPELREGVLVIPKLAPTPEGFPRRPGVAKKRPLA